MILNRILVFSRVSEVETCHAWRLLLLYEVILDILGVQPLVDTSLWLGTFHFLALPLLSPKVYVLGLVLFCPGRPLFLKVLCTVRTYLLLLALWMVLFLLIDGCRPILARAGGSRESVFVHSLLAAAMFWWKWRLVNKVRYFSILPHFGIIEVRCTWWLIWRINCLYGILIRLVILLSMDFQFFWRELEI